MGQVYSSIAKFCVLKTISALLLLFAFTSDLQARDPRQLTLMVADFDGTLGLNVGHFRLRRVAHIEAVAPFFKGMVLPEEIRVPVHDFEGNVGPQIAKRIGRLDEHGRFIPSTSLDPVTLSNGDVVIPGYYYFDLQTSLVEFRPPPEGQESYFVKAIDEKLKKKTPFLLDAFPLFVAAMDPKYQDHVSGVMLTMRGHLPAEGRQVVNRLASRMGLPKQDWPDEAFVNLSNPDFYEFGFSKTRYLERAFEELSDRVMADKSVPHYLVVFENDRKYLKHVDTLFKSLANRGVFSSPVIPVLVNLVEDAVLNQPDGQTWTTSPMQQIIKWSRVTVYWPNRVERSDDIGRVLELSLGMSSGQVKKFLKMKGPLSSLRCSQVVAEESK